MLSLAEGAPLLRDPGGSNGVNVSLLPMLLTWFGKSFQVSSTASNQVCAAGWLRCSCKLSAQHGRIYVTLFSQWSWIRALLEFDTFPHWAPRRQRPADLSAAVENGGGSSGGSNRACGLGPALEQLHRAAAAKAGTAEELSILFVALLRASGCLVRSVRCGLCNAPRVSHGLRFDPHHVSLHRWGLRLAVWQLT